MQNPPSIDGHFFPPFAGFPKAGIEFLRRLRKNNRRPWFRSHKEEYEQLVRFPMQCLVASLGERMADIAPEIEFHPKRSIFRIHRDVRFSRNKAPYKTNIAAVFSLKGKGRVERPGLYVGIEPGEVFLGGGVYMPNGDQLKAYRKSIAEHPDPFLKIVRHPAFRKNFGGIQGEKLRRSPLGYPPDHPMIEHLRHKQFYVGTELEEAACLRPRFLERAVATFTLAMPLLRWLAAAEED